MKIANRYKPFSHSPGTTCFIPGTSCEVRAYPTAVFVGTLQIEWKLTGLIKDFTLVQDLERGEVNIYGFAKEGYFSYTLFHKEGWIVVQLDRALQGFLKGYVQEPSVHEIFLQPKERLSLKSMSLECGIVCKDQSRGLERISFGNHKAQEWESIRRRKNPLEYLPFWFALGQQIPCGKIEEIQGTLPQLELCKQALQRGDKELCLQQLGELFEVGFDTLLMPKLYDTEYLGISALKPGRATEVRPLALLKEGYELIRAMLFEVKEEKIFLLPHVSEIMHAGRCLNFCMDQASFHIEWSKKLLKKVYITSHAKQRLHLCFQKPLKSFRLRKHLSEKRRGYCSEEHLCGDPIELERGEYLLDQFKK